MDKGILSKIHRFKASVNCALTLCNLNVISVIMGLVLKSCRNLPGQFCLLKTHIMLRLFIFLALPVALSAQTRLPFTHSHNDYEQAIPFKHAFDKGFHSIEADVWLVDGQLLVGHDRQDLRPDRTLESLYLAPLYKALRNKKTSREAPLQLLIDIKSEAISTLDALTTLLGKWDVKYPKNKVVIAVSGNRPPVDRYASYPGFHPLRRTPGHHL